MATTVCIVLSNLKFLEVKTQIFFSLFSESCPETLLTNEISNSSQIIVIGGGASGLAAASKLIENGFENVIILEASDRIGGRVHSSSYFEKHGYVELGAQFVHGQGGNVAYELANDAGLVDASRTEEDLIELFSFENEGPLEEYITYNLWILLYELDQTVRYDEENISVGEKANNVFDVIAAQ